MQAEIRESAVPFHWMVEFPEVFYINRQDPLDGGKRNRAAHKDAFLGNPPFLGGTQISAHFGAAYLAWLQTIYDGAHGNVDLCAYFFRRADFLLGEHGTIGLIATNAIAQGDTRAAALQRLIRNDLTIYNATRALLWAGTADVAVAVVHLAKGIVVSVVHTRELDGVRVANINSRLDAKTEQSDPMALKSNDGLSFKGVLIYGSGFLLSPGEREALVAKSSANAERTFPFIGGEDVNTSPTQSFERYVINFGTMSLEDATRWPDLLQIVEQRVKPERDAREHNPIARRQKEYWWRFRSDNPNLYRAIAQLSRCLVTARVTKHLCFSFQPTDRVLNEKLFVFPFERCASFAILQSRVHETWTRLLSSQFGSSTTSGPVLNYSASDCFETFPFPQPDPRTVIPSLEDIGERLYTTRAAYMVDNNVGLTITYNRLKDPANQEPRILELRRRHEEMDRAVLDAYGWTDVEVPPYCPLGDDDKRKLERFEDEVIDRLFVLNAQRAEEEKLKGLAPGAKQKGAGKGTAKKSPKKKDAKSEGQVELGLLKEEDES